MSNGVDAHGLSLVPVGDGFIDLVEDFQYLGSCNSRNGELSREGSEHLSKAAKMFGCLCSSIFVNKSLSINTKIIMCLRCYCLSTLLYGAKT